MYIINNINIFVYMPYCLNYIWVKLKVAGLFDNLSKNRTCCKSFHLIIDYCLYHYSIIGDI